MEPSIDKTLFKVSCAGFCHDLGKLFDKQSSNLSKKEWENLQGMHLPKSKMGEYSHSHAALTVAFIEKHQDLFPQEFFKTDWGDGPNILHLAGNHHNPSHVLEQIITEADRLTSGMDRTEYDAQGEAGIAVADYKKTRLIPILELLNPEKPSELEQSLESKYAYPLQSWSTTTCFPVTNDQDPLTREQANQEYQQLTNLFAKELGDLPHLNTNIRLWFEHFEHLVMRHASTTPAARAGKVIPDVSLYDHLHSTAAFAAALYGYHAANENLTSTAIMDNDEKFLLISGDFLGIQSYIFKGFGSLQKHRSKQLRGRSFTVSLMTELAADIILQRIGLPHTSILFMAGGKFVILAPNIEKVKRIVHQTKVEINNWFVKHTYGETGISFCLVPAKPKDFEGSYFVKLWDRVVKSLDHGKYQRLDLSTHSGVVTGYLEQMGEQTGPCPLCDHRPINRNAPLDADTPCCAICHDHDVIGTNLVKKDFLAVWQVDAKVKGCLKEPLFGHYQISFYEQSNNFKDLMQSDHLLRFWCIGDFADQSIKAAHKNFRGYVPLFQSEDLDDSRLLNSNKSESKVLQTIDQIEVRNLKSFHHIAAMALSQSRDESGRHSGFEALGILKADVDHLGLLMSCGIHEKLYTISRLATLSRQLDFFFSAYLPYKLRNSSSFNQVYTVFSGGDDLFLIGPWNSMISLALEMHQDFQAYVAYNKNVHFSAGISIHKANTPVHQLAKETEIALEHSKVKRNCITIFGQTVTWEEFKHLQEVKTEIEEWLDKEYLSSSMLYRLNEIIHMVEKEAEYLKESAIHYSQIQWAKWRSLLVYAIVRNVGRGLIIENQQTKTKEIVTRLTTWLEEYKGGLRIPIWDIQYNRRK